MRTFLQKRRKTSLMQERRGDVKRSLRAGLRRTAIAAARHDNTTTEGARRGGRPALRKKAVHELRSPRDVWAQRIQHGASPTRQLAKQVPPAATTRNGSRKRATPTR
ncbi:hypothetical protein JR064_03100 [Xanthomonas sp. CFBP 8703]|uniref:DNA-binding protein n=1 Tax=Xanthomonas bonasiae TaxID=2810351 RepID=A0ABS3AXQ6_9XANT|nr:hypothetical protein [Xanthomonas bonasiae]MBN6101149.1 hypothetical protein [Xanthomonas bonasiae]